MLSIMNAAPMPSLLIRNLPVKTIVRLKERAKALHRSLEGEARQIIQEAADRLTTEEWFERVEQHRKELAAYQKKRGIKPLDVVAIIRRDRRSH